MCFCCDSAPLGAFTRSMSPTAQPSEECVFACVRVLPCNTFAHRHRSPSLFPLASPSDKTFIVSQTSHDSFPPTGSSLPPSLPPFLPVGSGAEGRAARAQGATDDEQNKRTSAGAELNRRSARGGGGVNLPCVEKKKKVRNVTQPKTKPPKTPYWRRQSVRCERTTLRKKHQQQRCLKKMSVTLFAAEEDSDIISRHKLPAPRPSTFFPS